MQITPHVHSLRIPFIVPTGPGRGIDRFVNVFVLLGTRTWVVDTGVAGSHSALLNLVQEVGRTPETVDHIMLTHGHVDHIGAAKALRDITHARVYAHPAEREWIEDIDTQAAQRPVPGFHQLVGGSLPIDHLLTDGQVLELSPELHLQVIHCPGHSPGSTSFFLQEEAIVIAGDAVPVPGDMPVYDDPLISIQSIMRLKSLGNIRALVSAWDEPRQGEEAQAALNRAIELIERIHVAVRAVGKQLDPSDPLVFCRKVLGVLQLPEALANPLVARTFLGHYQLREREVILAG